MQRFKNILLYAGSEDNGAGIQRAIELARENDARLTLMDVIKPMPPTIGFKSHEAKPDEVEKLIAEQHHQDLTQLAGKYSDSGVSIETVVTIGDPAVEMVRRVMRDRHDLVVKTADGFSPVGRLFGSVGRSLMRLCPCPVWVLKPEIHGALDIILAAVDLDAGDAIHDALNRHIVSIADSIAARERGKLHVVFGWDLWMEASLRRHAGDDEIDLLVEAQKQKAAESMDRLLSECGIDADQVTVHLNRGSPTRVIPFVVDRIAADLLVMGTVCRTGVAGFLIGNTAETILTDLTCSVLTLKPDGFRTPVELTGSLEDVEPWQMPPSLV